MKFSYGYGGTAKVRPIIWKWCGYGFITNHIDVNHIFLLHCKSLPFLDFQKPALPRLRRQVWRRRCHWMLSRSQHGSGQLVARIRFIIVLLFLNSYWMQLLQHTNENHIFRQSCDSLSTAPTKELPSEFQSQSLPDGRSSPTCSPRTRFLMMMLVILIIHHKPKRSFLEKCQK